jgi:hypothetical protein
MEFREGCQFGDECEREIMQFAESGFIVDMRGASTPALAG